MIEWNIQSRGHACRACGRPFADQQPYHTLLFDERQTYERIDVCEGCWTRQYSQGATSRKGFVSHWQGVFEVSAPRPEPIQKETAETLLRRLIGQPDPRFGAARFILAVMLERKRVLKVRDQVQQEGQRVFVYEHARTGDVFTIPDPNLQLGQLEAVQRDVAQLLERGVPPLPEALSAAPTVAAGAASPETPSDATPGGA
jgi:hypothetical protein